MTVARVNNSARKISAAWRIVLTLFARHSNIIVCDPQEVTHQQLSKLRTGRFRVELNSKNRSTDVLNTHYQAAIGPCGLSQAFREIIGYDRRGRFGRKTHRTTLGVIGKKNVSHFPHKPNNINELLNN